MNKQGCYPQDELEHLGNGDLDKGIEEVKKQGWKIISITEDHNSIDIVSSVKIDDEYVWHILVYSNHKIVKLSYAFVGSG